ncbi:MAG: prepilin-type N-terminal cleavage/methylation domain protein [Micavibrio sp.]|nr:prepilin-type N-terminal cleavage/methylation domain protein [Micavibrio sp.]
MSQRFATTRSQAGFTLVELAIVMIIIGLLIGGVLKGQELIGNAQVTATVAQLKAVEAATSTFKDTYAGIPGDLKGENSRLPSCTALPCMAGGNGDQKLNSTPDGTPDTEATAFFPQLSVANLMTGIVPGTNAWGGNFPAAKISANGIIPGSITTIATGLTGAVGTLGASSGLYLAVVSTVAGASATNVGLKPTEASRIDTKLDDGVPGSGSVLGIGGTTCGSATATGVYDTKTNNATCGLYVHIQG